jgi:rhodanese-related sulfurtransferase
MSAYRSTYMRLAVWLVIAALGATACGGPSPSPTPAVSPPGPTAQLPPDATALPGTTPPAPAAPVVVERLRALVISLAHSEDEGMIEPEDAAASPDAFLVDVRDTDEITRDGYIVGAVHIPIRELIKGLDTLPVDRPIVVYSTTGHRGAMALAALRLLGYEEARSLSGGLYDWRAAGLPVAQGAIPTPTATSATPARTPAGTAAGSPSGTPAGTPAGTPSGTPLAPRDPEVLAALDRFFSQLPSGYYTISPRHLAERLGDRPAPFVLDVREPEVVASEGAITGSVNIPMATAINSPGQLPEPGTPIVVYGSSIVRSALVVMVLRLAGYRDVVALAGGLHAWRAAGLPVITSGTPSAPASATPGRATPSVTPSRRLTPSVTPSRRLTPSVTPSRRLTPSVTPSRRLTPSVTPRP